MFNLRRLLSVGSYRRGKSYFANTYGHHNGFELGSKVDESTNGIYIWDAPFLHDDKRKFLFRVLIAFSKDYNLLTYNKFVGVIVLDCEGIDDPKPWATKHDFKNMENQHIMFPKRHNTFLEDYKDMMDG